MTVRSVTTPMCAPAPIADTARATSPPTRITGPAAALSWLTNRSTGVSDAAAVPAGTEGCCACHSLLACRQLAWRAAPPLRKQHATHVLGPHFERGIGSGREQRRAQVVLGALVDAQLAPVATLSITAVSGWCIVWCSVQSVRFGRSVGAVVDGSRTGSNQSSTQTPQRRGCLGVVTCPALVAARYRRIIEPAVDDLLLPMTRPVEIWEEVLILYFEKPEREAGRRARISARAPEGSSA